MVDKILCDGREAQDNTAAISHNPMNLDARRLDQLCVSVSLLL
tara:strand:- start:66 stop:194 length:129 start_codon:yes stop_codon:yes gene_type:complete